MNLYCVWKLPKLYRYLRSAEWFQSGINLWSSHSCLHPKNWLYLNIILDRFKVLRKIIASTIAIKYRFTVKSLSIFPNRLSSFFRNPKLAEQKVEPLQPIPPKNFCPITLCTQPHPAGSCKLHFPTKRSSSPRPAENHKKLLLQPTSPRTAACTFVPLLAPRLPLCPARPVPLGSDDLYIHRPRLLQLRDSENRCSLGQPRGRGYFFPARPGCSLGIYFGASSILVCLNPNWATSSLGGGIRLIRSFIVSL